MGITVTAIYNGLIARMVFICPGKAQTTIESAKLFLNGQLVDNRSVICFKNGKWVLDLGTEGAVRTATNTDANREVRNELIDRLNLGINDILSNSTPT